MDPLTTNSKCALSRYGAIFSSLFLRKNKLCDSKLPSPNHEGGNFLWTAVEMTESCPVFLCGTLLLFHASYFLPSSAQPAVVKATASVWSPVVRCMQGMTTMSTAISLHPTVLGCPLRATCRVILARARLCRSGGLEFGDRWESLSMKSPIISKGMHINLSQPSIPKRPYLWEREKKKHQMKSRTVIFQRLFSKRLWQYQQIYTGFLQFSVIYEGFLTSAKVSVVWYNLLLFV